MEEVKALTKGRSIEEMIGEFEESLKNRQRKVSHGRKLHEILEQFQTFCASANIKTVDQIDKNAMLRFVGWLEKNLETRQGGHPNNTYRNKLKDVRVFLIDAKIGMPLKPKDWPKEVRARKEKYSVVAVKNMLAATSMDRHHE